MDENNKKSEVLMSMMEINHSPTEIEENDDKVISKFSFQDLTSMDASFVSLAFAVKSILPIESNATYKLNMRGLTGKVAQARDGSGLMTGVFKDGKLTGHAAFQKVPFDPTQLMIAIALASIEKKLSDIIEIQEEMFEFLRLQEKAKLKGNLNVLSEVMNNYKHHWNNDQYKNNKHILVQEIKRDAEQSIIFSRDRIKKKLDKTKLFHTDKFINKKINELISIMEDYRIALYLYSFSEFLEVLLLENFDPNYLDGVTKKNESYSYEYRTLYTDVYNKIEQQNTTSVQSMLLTGFANLNKIAGKTVQKIPVVGDTQIDENMLESAEKVKKFKDKQEENRVGKLLKVQGSVVSPFIDKLKMIDKIYNQTSDIIIDENNIVLLEHEEC